LARVDELKEAEISAVLGRFEEKSPDVCSLRAPASRRSEYDDLCPIDSAVGEGFEITNEEEAEPTSPLTTTTEHDPRELGLASGKAARSPREDSEVGKSEEPSEDITTVLHARGAFPITSSVGRKSCGDVSGVGVSPDEL
jgi:hypothetical protein